MSEYRYTYDESVELKYIEPIKSGGVWNIFEKHRGKRVFNVPNDLAFCVTNPDLMLKSDHDTILKSKDDEIEQLKQQLKKAEDVIRFYGDKNNWYMDGSGNEEENGFLWLSKFNPDEQDYENLEGTIMFNGKLAREYFKGEK